MTREEEIFEKALDFESDLERRGYLAGACAGDEKLMAAVVELLAADGEADEDDFLPTILGEAVIREGEGSIIGRYKLLQKLGEGGFGVVYMAEQREPVKRRVALKIIKLGMDTKHVIGRFEAERQALAMMEHPNIANVLDGGATEHGRPYFVMELVRGISITQFCDEQQLTTVQRLTLFQEVCHAVRHAHQKGVIHRDLKPSNVLVTLGDGNKPHPKVIDFGIAKATQQELTDKTLFTRFEDFVGTPAYMSPEQANYTQLDIDTRTDIYSLGVLLYELLTGGTPFDSSELISSGVDEIRRRIREEDPPRPSTRLYSLERAVQTKIAQSRQVDPERLGKELRGEVDWIIMKAIEKDRNRRYGTVEALSTDIENYLNGEAVEACPPTAAYRLKKFLHKHKKACATAGIVLATLCLGLLATAWQAVRVTKANARSTELLRDSYQVQANATRRLNDPGRHYESLSVLKAAAKIRPSVELRNEAIAAMVLPDMRLAQPLNLEMPVSHMASGAVDADGERYAIGNPQGEVRLYRVDDQSEIGQLPAHAGRVVHLLFSPNGKYLAVFANTSPNLGIVSVWDLDGFKCVVDIDDVHWGSVDFSPNSEQIAIGQYQAKRILLHSLVSDEQVSEFPCDHIPGTIKFDPAGSRLAVVPWQGNSKTRLVIFDLSGKEDQVRLQHARNVNSVAWHPNGEQVSVGTNGFNIHVWQLSTATRSEYYVVTMAKLFTSNTTLVAVTLRPIHGMEPLASGTRTVGNASYSDQEDLTNS